MNTNGEELKEQVRRYGKYMQRYLDKSRIIASKYLQKIKELPGAPKELEYFTNILKKVFVDNEVVKYNNNEKFIGSFCRTMPFEIISAAGARPLNLCSNNYVGFYIGDYVMARDVCPLSKACLGNIIGEISEPYNTCELFIVPLSCDCKKQLSGLLSNYKPTVSLYLPLNRSDDYGMETYVKELKKVAGKISEITGVKVTRESLANQIKIYADTQREIGRFVKLKREENSLIRGTHALAVMNAMAYDDVLNFGIHLKKLNDELLEKRNNQEYLTKKKLPRVLITGSSITFPNMKIPLIIEEQGGIVVADDMCLGEMPANDFVSVCDDSLNGYYKALANKYVKPCSCPIFPENEARIKKLDKIVEDACVDGIIYHVFRGCLVYDYEFEKIEKYFNAKGIPIIRVESDFNNEDVAVLSVRIEAFLEMINLKKKGDL